MNLKSMFSYEHSLLGCEIEAAEYPWDILPRLSEMISELGETLSPTEYERRGEDVWISRLASVAESAYIKGPTIICEGAEVRHCAFIRGGVLVGKGAVVGNSTEIKNAVLFDKAQAPHYNYIGDSILGFGAHFGAGAITSNVKGDKTNVTVGGGEEKLETGLRKFGALVGDRGEIGCGTVLNPGTVIGRNTQIYPMSSVRGIVGENKIYKSHDNIIDKENR